MKRKIFGFIIFIFFIGPIIYIYGAAGSSDLNAISISEYVERVIKALAVLGADAAVYLFIYREEENIESSM